ncbi:MAG: hypothetical protein ACFFDU_09375 [Candidatus Thorarchaeota archaeon]
MKMQAEERQMKTKAILCLQLPIDLLLEQFIHYLLIAWGVILFIGNFTAVVLIALGVIFWLSGRKPSRGRQMVVGGFVLFFAMQWMAFTAPWIAFLF